MLIDYLPILVLFLVALTIGIFVTVASNVLGPQRPSRRKLMPYESGMEPIGPAQRRFPIKFYRVALLFLIFDIELLFLFPYALVYRQLHLFGLAAMGVFFAVLVLGMVYEWKKGMLEW